MRTALIKLFVVFSVNAVLLGIVAYCGLADGAELVADALERQHRHETGDGQGKFGEDVAVENDDARERFGKRLRRLNVPVF